MVYAEFVLEHGFLDFISHRKDIKQKIVVCGHSHISRIVETDKKIIITTEKDAMRLQKFSNIANNLKGSFFYIPIQVKFLNNRTDNFNQQIIEYVRKNKKHSFLYPE